MKQIITCAIAGLGNRGNDIYGNYQFVSPEEMKVTAVAEPQEEKREAARMRYGLPENRCFSSAEEMLAQPKLADVMVIATQDRQHVEQAVNAIKKGYHVLCEKPISPDPEECRRLQKAAHEYQRIVAVGHVLRYTPFYSKIKKLIAGGAIGEVVSIQAMEQVTYWHQAHSYVRGNWRRTDETSPMILAKSCHDLDIFVWLLGKQCKKVSSYGGLYLFRPEKAPEGAAKRCLDGCLAKADCPYDAEKIYITNERTGIRTVVREGKTGDAAWPCCVLTPNDLSEAAVRKALETGPYGRCVYACDNDVVDHQVVNMEFEDGITVDFQMTAFTGEGGRTIHICGTKGDIKGNLGKNKVILTQFGRTPVSFEVAEGDMSGHAGGDNRLNLLVKLQRELGLTYLFIAHDLSMVKHISDRVGVMYMGHIVELASSKELYANPQHPYTKALLSAIPIPNPEKEKNKVVLPLEGEVGSPINCGPGCRFASRCKYATERCKNETPVLKEIEKEHFAACHLFD